MSARPMPRLRKSILALHRWVGLVTGALVFVIALTGAVYVFEEEIYNLAHRELIEVEPRDLPPAPASRLLAAAREAVAPGIPVRWIEGRGPRRSVQVHAYVYDDSARGLGYWNQQKAWTAVYLDPYTAEVLGVVERRFEFFNIVRQIHQNLGIRYEVGHRIVGISVLVFLAMLATGLVLWWPRNRAALKQRLRVAWTSGRRRRIFDLHAVPGFYALLPLLVIVVTGLGWSFEWWMDAKYLLLAGKTGDPWAGDPAVASVPPAEAAVPPDSLPAGASPALDRAFADVRRRTRPGHMYSVGAPQGEKDVIHGSYVDTVRSGWTTFTEIRYDRYSGEVLHDDAFHAKDIRKKYRLSMYDIHVGKIYGWPTQILAFLASLACAGLPVTGFLMWRSRRPRPRPRGNPTDSIEERTTA